MTENILDADNFFIGHIAPIRVQYKLDSIYTTITNFLATGTISTNIKTFEEGDKGNTYKLLTGNNLNKFSENIEENLNLFNSVEAVDIHGFKIQKGFKLFKNNNPVIPDFNFFVLANTEYSQLNLKHTEIEECYHILKNFASQKNTLVGFNGLGSMSISDLHIQILHIPQKFINKYTSFHVKNKLDYPSEEFKFSLNEFAELVQGLSKRKKFFFAYLFDDGFFRVFVRQLMHTHEKNGIPTINHSSIITENYDYSNLNSDEVEKIIITLASNPGYVEYGLDGFCILVDELFEKLKVKLEMFLEQNDTLKVVRPKKIEFPKGLELYAHTRSEIKPLNRKVLNSL